MALEAKLYFRPSKFKTLLLVLSFCIFTRGWLLYPTSTVLQITASVSAPVELKDMKLFFDWGFQVNYNLPYSLSNFYDVAKWPGLSRSQTQMQSRAIPYDKYETLNGTHPADASAGQIYRSLEESLISYGFHETCLLKSVCEVATYPFDLGEENVLAEVVSFILSPSLHQAFSKDEDIMREAYEAAERYGFSKVDCSYMYPECPVTPIDMITKIEYY